MTLKVVRFEAEHLALLDEVEAGPSVITPEAARQLEPTGRTILLDGKPIMCGGAVMVWNGRYQLWALLAPTSKEHMRFITKRTREYLDELRGRIECSVRLDFIAGHKWARLLGFKVETPVMEQYGPDREPHVGYVRLNHV